MYVDLPADHQMTAFLARVSEHPERVVRERAASFNGVERQREKYLVEKQRHEVIMAVLSVRGFMLRGMFESELSKGVS